VNRATRQRLVGAVLAGLVAALGPFRPRGLGYGVAAGLAAGLVVWFFLPKVLGKSERPQGSGAGSQVASVGWLSGGTSFSAWPVWLCLGLFFLLFLKTTFWFYQSWTAGVWQNGHGLFVPIVMVLLGIRALRGEDWGKTESSPWGLVVVTLALLLAVVDLRLQTRYLAAFGFLIGLAGLALTFLGTRRTRKLIFPIALGVFMVPIPFSVTDQAFLRLATAIPSLEILRLLGFSVSREYTVLLFPNFTLDISTACSGFSTLYAGLFFGVVLAAFSRPRWRQVLVVSMVLPISLLANVTRAVFLVQLTSLYGTGVLATDVHPASGAATFLMVIAGLVAVAGRRALLRVFA
jgi:exosortase